MSLRWKHRKRTARELDLRGKRATALYNEIHALYSEVKHRSQGVTDPNKVRQIAKEVFDEAKAIRSNAKEAHTHER